MLAGEGGGGRHLQMHGCLIGDTQVGAGSPMHGQSFCPVQGVWGEKRG